MLLEIVISQNLEKKMKKNLQIISIYDDWSMLAKNIEYIYIYVFIVSL